jgi:hypothetical protein
VLAQIRRLRDFPVNLSDSSCSDADGRRLDVSLFEGLAIYYWIDGADRHVKVLKITIED